MIIRYGTLTDILQVQAIAKQHGQALGFVRRVSLERGVANRELFVAELDSQVVGFVNWHARRDGWNTIYDIAVDKGCQGQGVGRGLLYAVPCPIRLKCPVDLPSNTFYKDAGMTLADTEPGKKRALNVWTMRVLFELVMGGNPRMPEIARQSGMPYGVRHTEKPYAWPFAYDVEWERFKKKPDEWSRYMALIREQHPVQAMAVDYEYPSQRRALYQQIRDLRQAGVLRIMVCPKFNGAIAHIPSWCLAAVSIPSSYAGFLPDFRELKGRKVHLLGGTPQKQRDILQKIRGHGGLVISMDGNSHLNGAMYNSIFIDGKFRRRVGEPINDFYATCEYAGNNVRKQQNAAAEWQQLPLEMK